MMTTTILSGRTRWGPALDSDQDLDSAQGLGRDLDSALDSALDSDRDLDSDPGSGRGLGLAPGSDP